MSVWNNVELAANQIYLTIRITWPIGRRRQLVKLLE